MSPSHHSWESFSIFKESCSGAHWIIQDTQPFSNYLTSSHFRSPFCHVRKHVHMFQELGHGYPWGYFFLPTACECLADNPASWFGNWSACWLFHPGPECGVTHIKTNHDLTKLFLKSFLGSGPLDPVDFPSLVFSFLVNSVSYSIACNKLFFLF